MRPDDRPTRGTNGSRTHGRGDAGCDVHPVGLYGLITASALVRYVQGGLYNNLYFDGGGVNSVNDDSVGRRTYLDLDGSVKLVEQVELFTQVNNVFDRDPPGAPQAVTQAAAIASLFYDRIGRYISAGVRFNF